jgi:hypothetical protein
VTDNLLQHYVYKSQTGVTDPLVTFFPSFFFTKLYQEGNADPKKADTYSYAGVASWTKKILRATPIDEMKTIVFLLNEGRMHWKCFAIFMDLKSIQAFDSNGSGGGQTLQDLYRWLHSTMEIEGKTLKPADGVCIVAIVTHLVRGIMTVACMLSCSLCVFQSAFHCCSSRLPGLYSYAT